MIIWINKFKKGANTLINLRSLEMEMDLLWFVLMMGKPAFFFWPEVGLCEKGL